MEKHSLLEETFTNFILIVSKYDKQNIIDTINIMLLETQNDLPLFNFVLNAKKCLLSKNIGKPSNFSIDVFVNEIKQIQCEDEKFQIVLEAIENLLQVNENPELTIEVLLNNEIVQDENKMISIYQVALETSKKLKFSDALILRLKKCIPLWATCSVKYAITCYKILPQYLQVTNDHSIYLEIYMQIQLSSAYHTICCLIPNLKNLQSNLFDLIYQKWYWTLIRKGLTSQDFTCKSAMFILKESIGLLTEENLHLYKEISLIEDDGNDFNLTHLKIDWKNFIILFEILDETQSHLILPALHLLDSISHLHSSWIAIIYSKLLNHNSQSVQQYGIQKIFDMNYENLYNQRLFHEISCDIALFLNKVSLYHNENDCKLSPFTEKLIKFFDRLNKNELLTELLNKIIEIDHNKWLSVPFFNICYGLTNSNYKIKENDIRILQTMIKISENTLNIFLRNSSQFMLLNFILYQNKNLIQNTTFLLLIDTLFTHCGIQRKDFTWNKFIDYLREHSIESCELNLLPGRIILLLFDSNIITKKNVENFLTDIFTNFIDIGIRYNVNQSQLDIQIDILINFLSCLDESNCDFYLNGNEIFIYTTRVISNFKNLNESIVMGKYSTVINLLLPHIDINKISNFIAKNLTEETPVLLKYYSLSLLVLILNRQLEVPYLNDITSKVSNYFNISSIINSNDLKAIPKCLITDFYNTLNWIKINYLKLYPDNSLQFYINNKDYLDEVTEFGGKEATSSTLKFTQLLFPIIIKNFDSQIKDLLKSNWDNLLDVKRCELFWSGIPIYVEMLLSSTMVSQKTCFKNIIHYVNQILALGENMRGLTGIIFNQLNNLWLENALNAENIEIFIPTIIEGVLFGPSKRKDEKIESNMCQVIESSSNFDTFPTENKYKLDLLARIKAIQLLEQLTDNPQFSKVTKEIFQRLLERYNRENKNRYFAKSQLHYSKNRILQILLLIQPKLSVEDNCVLYKWLCTILVKENFQTSVRYMIEWLFVNVLLQCDELLEDFYDKIDTFGERPSSLISVISILYHVAKTDEKQVIKIMSTILPHTIGSNFKIRLYAQWAFKQIYESTEKFSRINTADYKTIYQCLATTLSKINTEKNLIRLQNDFFFEVFDTKENFTIETIFDILPRLSLISEEALPIDLFTDQCSYLKNKNSDLRNSLQSQTVLHDAEDNFNVEQTEMIQKKIIPWNSIVPDIELFDRNSQLTVKKTNLIVIASLITKSTNLGGLARTCEIFGVSEYVISNSNILKDCEFQSLSVSAENWLQITSINSSQLTDYLLSLKANGYTIVGCEQTSNSIQLQTYNFPVKSAILFGNEKEGIPSNILGFVDICVEIPQIGIIRSLNVHVSGALSIWEYSRQHSFEKSY